MPRDSKEEDGIPLLDVEAQDEENDDHSKPNSQPQSPAARSPATGLGRRFIIWTIINMVATIGIVFTNKAIFNDPSFQLMQTSFACFHFICTGLTLFIVSRPRIGAFVPKVASIKDMLPLAFCMCLNVVLPNLSLAFCTVPVYQLSRVLLTPMTASINYALYHATIPRNAAFALIPVCLGVGITSFYDTQAPPKEGAGDSKNVQTTSMLGIIFALSGVCASSLYTVFIGAYHKKLQMSSSQLLLNQAPIASAMLVIIAPLADKFPNFEIVPAYRWAMILMSGGFASLINISQFFIVAGAGPVASTVVGHLKTVSIVVIGWAVIGRSVTDRGMAGILLTVAGIILYSYIMINKPK